MFRLVTYPLLLALLIVAGPSVSQDLPTEARTCDELVYALEQAYPLGLTGRRAQVLLEKFRAHHDEESAAFLVSRLLTEYPDVPWSHKAFNGLFTIKSSEWVDLLAILGSRSRQQLFDLAFSPDGRSEERSVAENRAILVTVLGQWWFASKTAEVSYFSRIARRLRPSYWAKALQKVFGKQRPTPIEDVLSLRPSTSNWFTWQSVFKLRRSARLLDLVDLLQKLPGKERDLTITALEQRLRALDAGIARLSRSSQQKSRNVGRIRQARFEIEVTKTIKRSVIYYESDYRGVIKILMEEPSRWSRLADLIKRASGGVIRGTESIAASLIKWGLLIGAVSYYAEAQLDTRSKAVFEQLMPEVRAEPRPSVSPLTDQTIEELQRAFNNGELPAAEFLKRLNQLESQGQQPAQP